MVAVTLAGYVWHSIESTESLQAREVVESAIHETLALLVGLCNYKQRSKLVIRIREKKVLFKLPGMRPWKSKEGRPLVNPSGNPRSNSGFPRDAGRAP